jgi:hypothetical protein
MRNLHDIFCPTSLFAAGPQGNLLVIKVLLLIKYRSKAFVGDIPNGYTSDVVLNQQARVAHQGGMADCLPGGPVAGSPWRILDVGAHGGSGDRPVAGCLVVHA